MKNTTNSTNKYRKLFSKKQYSLAFGTGYLSPGDETYNAVINAIAHGYRIFDTAHYYRNESDLGKAIIDSGIKREDFIIVTKLSHGNKNPHDIKQEFHESLGNLRTKYIDIYLIHAPKPWNDTSSDWMENNVIAFNSILSLKESGLIKEVGVSNFEIEDLKNIFEKCNEIPKYNQMPFFIGNYNRELIDLCRNKGIVIMSSSPLANGKLLKNEIVIQLSKEYESSPAQLCLKYLIQKGSIPIVRSLNSNHLYENQKLNFVINEIHMLVLDSIEDDPRVWG